MSRNDERYRPPPFRNRDTTGSASTQPAATRPQPRRGPSGAWSRLKPANMDPLEVYGLPSKGETRLHDFKTQETYYTKIVERYMKFCASAGGSDELEAAFAALHLHHTNTKTNTTTTNERPPLPRHPSSTDRPNDMPSILMAMRKLREGILGSRRRDAFAQRAYIFVIHASMLTRHWESYQPALLYLLTEIHPHTPLPPAQLQEFVGYLVLDLACRQFELLEAFTVRLEYGLRNRRVVAVLRALVHDDWVRFWRIMRAVDGFQRAIMQFAVERMRTHALKCLGKGYLNADVAFVERSADSSWAELVKGGVGWQLQESGSVMIRKPKAK